jgi:ATP-binding cassette subfamily B protein
MTATSTQVKKDDPLLKLPQAAQEVIGKELPAETVEAAAGFDLDSHGRYIEGYLVLADGQLHEYIQQDGKWQHSAVAVSTLKEARIVEGLGMSILRLLGSGDILAEHRFTLRHARQMARLHRRLERRLEGKPLDEAELEPPRDDEKKTRCDKCGLAIPPWAEVCPACLQRRKVLSRLVDFVKPYKWQAIAGGLLAVAATLMGLVRPYLTKPMLNRGLGAQKGYEPDYRLLMTYVLLLAAMMVLTAFGSAFQHRLLAKLAARMGRDIRIKIYAHLHKLSLSFFSKKPTGSLVTRITSDSDRIWDFVAFTLIEVIIAFLTVVGVSTMLFVLNWRLALIVLIPIPFMVIMTIIFHRRMHGFFGRMWHRWSQMTSVVSDALPGVRVIKAFSQEQREIDRFQHRNVQYFQGETEMINLWTLFGPVLQLATQVASVLVWAVGGYWVVTKRYDMDPGTLMAYLGYMWMFYGPIHMISHMDRMFNRAATSVQRIFEILDTEPTIFSKTSAHRSQDLSGDIELRNVSFSYDGIRKVLKNVNLTIRPGEMIGLAGPSGGGKTTLVNLICRFYDVLEGQILIDGVDVRDYDLTQLRRRIGVVLQEPFLFYGTVAQNVAYGRPEATLDRIIEAAKAANAHDFIVGFPDGYDTMVGERGQSLSAGERQRVSIARAILNNPRLLILDEATSSVDTETEKLIQQALDRLVADRTTIAIAHRLSTLRKAGRIVVLDKGEIIEQGSHDELSAKDGGTYAKLVSMQTQMQSIMAIGG